MNRVTLKDLIKHPKVMAYIDKANEHLGAIGYTEHGQRHASHTATVASKVIERLKYSKRDVELAAIAGYLHDIGNLLGRPLHGVSGGILAERILDDMGMRPDEIAIVVSAISNHDEESGVPTDNVSAAVLLADKADVHRSRVRTVSELKFDIHDRVNYAAERSFLVVDKKHRKLSLEVTINTDISQVMEYFEIFLSRMIVCRRAAKCLKCEFELFINDVKLL